MQKPYQSNQIIANEPTLTEKTSTDNDFILKLFSTRCRKNNYSGTQGDQYTEFFEQDPTIVTETNCAEFLNVDHSPICFEDGRRRKTHQPLYATACVADFDNEANDCTLLAAVINNAKKLGLKNVPTSSRSHHLLKDGILRGDRFHVWFPASRDLDMDTWLAIQLWIQHEFAQFQPDAKVKSQRQIIYGNCDNPNFFVEFNKDGVYIDEYLKESDIAPFRKSNQTETKSAPKIKPSKANRTINTDDTLPGKIFEASGESREVIYDLLIEKGWEFIGEQSGNSAFYKPGKNKRNGSPSAHLNEYNLHIFTDSGDLTKEDMGHFSAYAWLKWDGDFTAASRDLAAQGYCNDEIVTENIPVSKQAEYPLHCFPPVLKRFIKQTSDQFGVPVSMVGTTMLGAVSGAIGNSKRIELTPVFHQPAILWMLSLARPGARKSPVVDYLKTLFKNAYEVAKKTQKEACEQIDKERAELKEQNRIAKRDDQPQVEIPKKAYPKQIKHLVDNMTTEGLCKLLEYCPNGIFMFTDEFGQWSESFGEYKRSNSDVYSWCKGFDGSRHERIRADETRSSSIEHFTVNFTTMSQPDTLRTFLSKPNVIGSGLWDRFLVCYSDFGYVSRKDDFDMASFYDVQRIFDKILHIEGESFVIYQGEEREVKVDADAYALFKETEDKYGEETVEMDNMFATYWGKRLGKVARIALCLHIVKSTVDKSIKKISLETMQEAIEIEQWYCDEAIRVYPMLNMQYAGAGNDAIDKDDIVALLRENVIPMSARDISRKIRRFRKTPDKLQEALNQLVDEQIIDECKTSKSIKYCLND